MMLELNWRYNPKLHRIMTRDLRGTLHAGVRLDYIYFDSEPTGLIPLPRNWIVS